jgi:hypothetical protein
MKVIQNRPKVIQIRGKVIQIGPKVIQIRGKVIRIRGSWLLTVWAPKKPPGVCRGQENLGAIAPKKLPANGKCRRIWEQLLPKSCPPMKR